MTQPVWLVYATITPEHLANDAIVAMTACERDAFQIRDAFNAKTAAAPLSAGWPQYYVKAFQSEMDKDDAQLLVDVDLTEEVQVRIERQVG